MLVSRLHRSLRNFVIISVELSPCYFRRLLHRFFDVLLSSLGATLSQDSAAFLHLTTLSLNISMHEDTTSFMTATCMSSMSSVFAMASLMACKYTSKDPLHGAFFELKNSIAVPLCFIVTAVISPLVLVVNATAMPFNRSTWFLSD